MRTLSGTRTLRPAVFWAAVVMLPAVLAGCASSGQPQEGEEEAPAVLRGAQRNSIHVTNRNWMDMMIYAVRGSERYRLLSVTSMRTDSASIPRSLFTGSGFRLMADPVGAIRPYYSSTIYLRRGQTVWWTLEDPLSYSSLWVY